MRYLLFALWPFPVFALVPPDIGSLQLSVGGSETLKVPGLVRAAVGNSKLVRARPVPPDSLLLIGLKAGITTVRAWDEKAGERSLEVTVVPVELASGEDEGVIKVALEFLELDLAVGKTFGVQWPDAIQFSSNATWQGASAVSGLNYVVTFNSTQGWLHHLIREGWGRVLAHPDLYVRLGEEATFHSGGEVPITTTAASFAQSFQHVEWKPFGITVKVRPRSGDGVNVRADIHVDISELNRAGSIEGIPSFTKRELNTKINARNGETVLLSGLVRQASGGEKRSVPVLSAIPLLGSLFTSRSESRDESEVLMAVTFSFATHSRTQRRLEESRERILRQEGLP